MRRKNLNRHALVGVTGEKLALSADDRLGARAALSTRIFLIFLGVLLVGSGALIVSDSVQASPVKPQILGGLLFAIVGCLMVFAGISKRTEIKDSGGPPGYFGD
jgi:hypothetical protein